MESRLFIARFPVWPNWLFVLPAFRLGLALDRGPVRRLEFSQAVQEAQ